MKQFEIVNFYGNQTYIRVPPSYIDVAVLSANTAKSMTVPSSGTFVIFSADGDFYAKPNGTASIPVTHVEDGLGSELNPSAWCITSLTTIGLISATARKVSLSYYSAKKPGR